MYGGIFVVGFWIVPIPFLLLGWALSGSGEWSVVLDDMVFRFIQYALALAVGWLIPLGKRHPLARLALLAVGAMAIHAAGVGFLLLTGAGQGMGALFFANLPHQLSTVLGLAWLGQTGRAALDRQKLLAESSELEARIARARTLAYRAQLQPEFVLGCLDRIARAMRTDPYAADDILLEMSDLLRLSLVRLRADELPLQSETAFLSAYLRLERLRSGEEGSLELKVGPGLGSAMVPTGVLTDLVRELGSRLGRPVGAGRLTVEASSSDGELCLSARCAEGSTESPGGPDSHENRSGRADGGDPPSPGVDPSSRLMRRCVPLRFDPSGSSAATGFAAGEPHPIDAELQYLAGRDDER